MIFDSISFQLNGFSSSPLRKLHALTIVKDLQCPADLVLVISGHFFHMPRVHKVGLRPAAAVIIPEFPDMIGQPAVDEINTAYTVILRICKRIFLFP